MAEDPGSEDFTSSGRAQGDFEQGVGLHGAEKGLGTAGTYAERQPSWWRVRSTMASM